MRATVTLVCIALALPSCGGLIEPTPADGGSGTNDSSTIGEPPTPAPSGTPPVPPGPTDPPVPPPKTPDGGPPPPPPPTKCIALGGKCVTGKWANCPAGTQPSEDIHADCMPPGSSRGYFCCVPAPASPCADDKNKGLDCFANGKCEACWSSGGPGSLACAGGRTCCAYTCTD